MLNRKHYYIERTISRTWCTLQFTNQLILKLWSVALWPDSYSTLLHPGSILRPSFNCLKPALHCIRSSCSSIKIIIWFFLVLVVVSAVYGDLQFLDDALENSIFSSIKCGQRHLWFYNLGIGSLFITSEVISGYFKVDVRYIRLLFISFILGCWLWIFQPCDRPPYLLSTHPMKDASAVVPFYEFCLDKHRLWSIVWTATWVCNCSQIWVHVQLHSFGKKILIFRVCQKFNSSSMSLSSDPFGGGIHPICCYMSWFLGWVTITW